LDTIHATGRHRPVAPRLPANGEPHVVPILVRKGAKIRSAPAAGIVASITDGANLSGTRIAHH
jgi:hypothetical protein